MKTATQIDYGNLGEYVTPGLHINNIHLQTN